MTIYIASSWKNQHAVEMLTDLLRLRGHLVYSFVENNHASEKQDIPFPEWIDSEDGFKSFQFDTLAAKNCDLTIYVGPSGCDAWAEVGIAFSNEKRVLGLMAKGETIGLMRRIPDTWFTDYRKLLTHIDLLPKVKPGRLVTVTDGVANTPA